MTKEIKFFRPYQTNGEFSNFYEADIVIKGKKYKTNEHYFQSKKFENKKYKDDKNEKDYDIEEYIRKSDTPAEAFRRGRSRKYSDYLEKDWDKKKIKVMAKCLKAKFKQHDKLKKKLLDTGDATIIENSPYDSFWGVGKNGKGLNMLGKLLMELRDILNKN